MAAPNEVERLEPRVRLVIEVQPGIDPITGVVRSNLHVEHAFTGWLELSTLIEDILDATRPS